MVILPKKYVRRIDLLKIRMFWNGKRFFDGCIKQA
jgi:hypothetical protein